MPGLPVPDPEVPGLEVPGLEVPDPEVPDPEVARTRRQSLAEIFGDVLPEATADDLDPDPAPSDEHWFVENRPPHHGG